MDFSYIQDNRWQDLDSATQDQMISLAFEKEVKSDPRWNTLAAEEQEAMFQGYQNQAQEMMPEPEPDPAPGVIKTIGKGLSHGAHSLIESAGTGVEYLGQRVGSETLKDVGQATKKVYGNFASEYNPSEAIEGKNVWDNPELLKNSEYWLYNVSDMVPMLAASVMPGMLATKGLTTLGAVPKLAKLGGAIIGGGFGGAVEGAQTYNAVLARGGTETEAARSAELMTAGAGVLNALSVGKILSKAGTGFKANVIKTLGASAWEGITEGLEEPTEVFSKYFGSYLAGEPLPKDLKDQLIESAKAALTVAPIAAVAGGGGSIMSDLTYKPPESIIAAPTVDTAIESANQEIDSLVANLMLDESDQFGDFLTAEQARNPIAKPLTIPRPPVDNAGYVGKATKDVQVKPVVRTPMKPAMPQEPVVPINPPSKPLSDPDQPVGESEGLTLPKEEVVPLAIPINPPDKFSQPIEPTAVETKEEVIKPKEGPKVIRSSEVPDITPDTYSGTPAKIEKGRILDKFGRDLETKEASEERWNKETQAKQKAIDDNVGGSFTEDMVNPFDDTLIFKKGTRVTEESISKLIKEGYSPAKISDFVQKTKLKMVPKIETEEKAPIIEPIEPIKPVKPIKKATLSPDEAPYKKGDLFESERKDIHDLIQIREESLTALKNPTEKDKLMLLKVKSWQKAIKAGIVTDKKLTKYGKETLADVLRAQQITSAAQLKVKRLTVKQKEKEISTEVKEKPEKKKDFPEKEYNKSLSEQYAKEAKGYYSSGDLEAPEYIFLLDLLTKKDLVGAKKILEILNNNKDSGGNLNLADKIIKGKGGADLKRLIGMLGSQMYKGNLAEVTIKEIVQNSFDAVKASINQGKVKDGQIVILADSISRTIAIKDNGQGMSKEVILNAFLTVAGTSKEGLKEGQASGGFGMAKAAFLYGNEWISVNTVKGGKRYRFKASGDELLSKEINITESNASKKDHGTIITIKVPEYVDIEGEQKFVWFPENVQKIAFFRKPLLHDNVNVVTIRPENSLSPGEIAKLNDANNKLWDQGNITTIPIGKNFDISKYEKNTTAKFDWGTAELYIGKDRKTNNWDISHSVLSSGIYQFNESFDIKQWEKIPFDIIVNVHPTVDAASPAYPFNVKREGWKDTISKDIEALKAYVKNVALGIEAQETVNQFKNIKSLQLIDVGDIGTSHVDITEFITPKKKDKINLTPTYSPTTVTIQGGQVTGKDIKGNKKVFAVSKDQEKIKLSFKADKVVPSAKDFLIETGVDDSKPIFHNNTNVDYFELAESNGLSAEEFFAELGSVMLKVKEAISESSSWGYDSLTDKDQSFFFGISIDKGYHGVNTVIPFKAALLNPLAIKQKTLPGLTYGYYDTIVHEIAHIPQRNHDASFVSEMAKLHSTLASDGTDLELRVMIGRVLKKHQKLINILRGEFEKSTTKNLAKSLDKTEGDRGVAAGRIEDGSKTSIDARNGERFEISAARRKQERDSGISNGNRISEENVDNQLSSPSIIKFQTGAKVPGEGVTLKDIQAQFKGQQVFVGPNKEVSVVFKNGQGITITQVKDFENGDKEIAIQSGQMGKDGIILGSTEENKITLNKDLADPETLAHEMTHTLKNLGILTKKDENVLFLELNKLNQKNKFRYDRSTMKDKVAARDEDLANVLAQVLTDRKAYRDSVIGKIIQKITDFIDGLMAIGKSTTVKLAKEVESGKIFSRTPERQQGKSKANSTLEPKPMFQTKDKKESNQVFDVPEVSTKKETANYAIIDVLAPFVKTQKAISKEPLSEDQDYVLAERLRRNQVSAEITKSKKTLAQPIVDLMIDNDYALTDVDEALLGQHAPEANARLRLTNARRFLLELSETHEKDYLKEKINDIDEIMQSKEIKELSLPNSETQKLYLKLLTKELQYTISTDTKKIKVRWNRKSEKFSGTTDQEAKAIQEKWANEEDMQKILKLTNKLTKATLDISLNSGRITQDEYDAFNNTFKHYVPLQREGHTSQSGIFGTGQGIVNLGKDYKIRGGSEAKAVNMFTNALLQHEQAIRRAGKANAGRIFLKLVKDNPNPDFWSISEKTMINAYDAHGNIYKKDDFKIEENDIPLKLDGKYYIISMNADNAHAVRIAKHLKGTDVQTGWLVKGLSKFNRLLATVYTGLNPEFIITNPVRDIQIASINLSSTELKDMTMKVMKDLPKAALGLRDLIRKDGSTKWGKIAKEAEEDGMLMSWSEQGQDVEKLSKSIQREVKLQQDNPKANVARTTMKIGQLIKDYNMIAENMTRLAAYKNARDVGMTRAKSALLGKELTVNFEQKGLYGEIYNSLYLFSSAGVQGSTRLITGLIKSPKARKMVGGMMLSAMGVAITNGLFGGDDDDGKNNYNNINAYDKERNMVFIIPNSDGKIIKVPLGWGLNFFWNIGTEIGDAMLSFMDPKKFKYDPLESASRLASIGVNAFNPVQSATLLQTITPTSLDIVAQVGENKTFSGSPLMPEKNKFADVPTPDSQRYWKSVRPSTKVMAEWINNITRGDKVESGKIDVSPETLDLILDTYTGGMGKFFEGMVKLPKALGEDDIDIRKIPIVRKFVGTTNKNKGRQDFYENAKEIKLITKKIKTYPKRRREFQRDPRFRLVESLKSTERQINALRKVIKKTRSEKSKDRLEKRIERLQDRFNKHFDKRINK